MNSSKQLNPFAIHILGSVSAYPKHFNLSETGATFKNKMIERVNAYSFQASIFLKSSFNIAESQPSKARPSRPQRHWSVCSVLSTTQKTSGKTGHLLQELLGYISKEQPSKLDTINF